MSPWVQQAAQWTVQNSLAAVLLAVVVLGMRRMFRRAVSPVFWCLAGWLVIFRLLLPEPAPNAWAWDRAWVQWKPAAPATSDDPANLPAPEPSPPPMVPTPEVAQRSPPGVLRASSTMAAKLRAASDGVPSSSSGVCMIALTGATDGGAWPKSGDSASGLIAQKQSMLPSGAARATSNMATLPPAPGRFSTTMDRSSTGASRRASTRATVSLTPPGG